VDGAFTSTGDDKLSAALATAIPFAYLICHLKAAFLLPLDLQKPTYYKLWLKQCQKPLLPHNLYHDLPGTGPVVEVHHYDLLPGTQRQVFMAKGNYQRGPQQ
jgi:hypothetical protein